jgi:hypothetical protein
MSVLRIANDLAGIICIFALTWLCIKRLSVYNESYISITDQIHNEKWLLGQCKDADFFEQMSFVSDICRDVLHNSQISARLHALQSSVFGDLLNDLKSTHRLLDYDNEGNIVCK